MPNFLPASLLQLLCFHLQLVNNLSFNFVMGCGAKLGPRRAPVCTALHIPTDLLSRRHCDMGEDEYLLTARDKTKETWIPMRIPHLSRCWSAPPRVSCCSSLSACARNNSNNPYNPYHPDLDLPNHPKYFTVIPVFLTFLGNLLGCVKVRPDDSCPGVIAGITHIRRYCWSPY